MASKKEGIVTVKLQLPAGKATPAPPVGPALGQTGINIGDFCKQFNDKTKNEDAGLIFPVIVSVAKNKSFTFELKKPPVSILIKKEVGLAKGSGTPNKAKVGKLSKESLRKIAEIKKVDMNAFSLEAAMSMIAGTAKSMGVEVEI